MPTITKIISFTDQEKRQINTQIDTLLDLVQQFKAGLNTQIDFDGARNMSLRLQSALSELRQALMLDSNKADELKLDKIR